MLRRLGSMLSLAVGVAVVLFVIFDSGVLGDPALRAVGRHGSARAVGEARVRLGIFRGFRPAAATLVVEGPPARFFLEARGDALVLADFGGRALLEAPLRGRSVAALAAEWKKVALGESHVLRAEAASGSAAAGPASGLAAALAGAPRVIDAGRRVELDWAERVPLLTRFLDQTGRLLLFDFGRSDASGQPIGGQLVQRGLRSLALTVPAFFLSTLLAVFLALFAAALRGRFDRILLGLSVAGMSVTSLAYILFLQKWLARDLGWFPVFGWEPPYVNFLVLPILIWLLVALGPDVRLYRTVMLGEVSRPYVRTARAKGLGTGGVLFRHVLPNAMLPILTQVIVALPFLFLGSLLLERFFGIPGLGGYTVEAVFQNDQQVLRATTFLFSILYLGAQAQTDLFYTLVDPRVRVGR